MAGRMRDDLSGMPDADQVRFLWEQWQAQRNRIQLLEADCEREKTLKEEAERQPEMLKTQLVALAEAVLPAEVTALRQGEDVGGWDIGRWLVWLTRTLLTRFRHQEMGSAANAGAEIDQLRGQVDELMEKEARLREERDHERRLKESAEHHLRVTRDELRLLQDRLKGEEEEPSAAPVEEGPPHVVGVAEKAKDEIVPIQAALPIDVEYRFGQYWGESPRELVDGVIRQLARGEECRRRQLLETLGETWGRKTRGLFGTLLEKGWVDEVESRLLAGRPVGLLWLTERGEDLARALGANPRKGLQELLRRHRTEKQAQLALMARDVLEGWGHTVDLWPGVRKTASGKQCRPDTVVTTPEGRVLFVELEVNPLPRGRGSYKKLDGRHNKWRIFHEVNGGCLYVVVPTPAAADRLNTEMGLWKGVTSLEVTLFSTTVRPAGQEWRRTVV